MAEIWSRYSTNIFRLLNYFQLLSLARPQYSAKATVPAGDGIGNTTTKNADIKAKISDMKKKNYKRLFNLFIKDVKKIKKSSFVNIDS